MKYFTNELELLGVVWVLEFEMVTDIKAFVFTISAKHGNNQGI